MHVISKTIEFDAGHRVPLHASKCRNPHGHRYKVEATVSGPLATTGSSTGMVVDFGHLKELLQNRVHDVYDHGFIIWEGDVDMLDAFEMRYDLEWKVIIVPWHPTAENMAEAIFKDLQGGVRTLMPKCDLIGIKVWETPTSVAAYMP